MRISQFMKAGVGGLSLFAVSVPAVVYAETTETWDGLVQVKSSKLDAVYLEPYADFRGYTKVMFDTPEISFRKNWQRNVNRSRMSPGSRVTDRDARLIIEGGREILISRFVETFEKAGYKVVTTPGPDVMRISLAIMDLEVAAPDNMSPGVDVYVREAGRATIAVEVRDAESGDLLGRAVDKRRTGERGDFYLGSSVFNASEFGRLFSRWARITSDGLNELKSLSPVDNRGVHSK